MLISFKQRAISMAYDPALLEEELLQQLAEYKAGHYQYGKYRYEGDIAHAYKSGKTFVLRGALKAADWLIIAFLLVPALILLLKFAAELVTLSIVFALFIPLFLLKYFNKLIVGPNGFCKINMFGRKVFRWQEVVEILGLSQGFTMLVKVILVDGKKCQVSTYPYSRKEFPRDFANNLFRLFKVYSGVSGQFASTQTSFGLGDIPLP